MNHRTNTTNSNVRIQRNLKPVNFQTKTKFGVHGASKKPESHQRQTKRVQRRIWPDVKGADSNNNNKTKTKIKPTAYSGWCHVMYGWYGTQSWQHGQSKTFPQPKRKDWSCCPRPGPSGRGTQCRRKRL